MTDLVKRIPVVLTDEDLAVARALLDQLAHPLDQDLGPAVLCPPMLALARELRAGLFDQLNEVDRANNSLGEHYRKRVAQQMAKRWPTPIAGRTGPLWRQDHLSRLERDLLWQCTDEANRRGVRGLAHGLQLWEDHVRRVFIAEISAAWREVLTASPRGLDLAEVMCEVEESRALIAEGLRYTEKGLIEWDESTEIAS